MGCGVEVSGDGLEGGFVWKGGRFFSCRVWKWAEEWLWGSLIAFGFVDAGYVQLVERSVTQGQNLIIQEHVTQLPFYGFEYHVQRACHLVSSNF